MTAPVQWLKALIRKSMRRLGYVIVSEQRFNHFLTVAERAVDAPAAPATNRPAREPDSPPEFSTSKSPAAPSQPRPATGPVSTLDPAMDARLICEIASAAYDKGDFEKAYQNYKRAMTIIHRYDGARAGMGELSKRYYADACQALEQDDKIKGRRTLVMSIECDPRNAEARGRLEKLIAADNLPDLTKHCYIFYDGQRAEVIHRETVLRCLEYVSIGGVVGDILEFGTLGGWSARIFCETMRDLSNMNDIQLFDSFDGLPEYTSAVDVNSYEVGGRNIWSARMALPDDLIRQTGATTMDRHIRERLSDIIRGERIKIHRGYFSETLKTPLNVKASIVHIDCDLYQSTVDVFQRLYATDVFQDGCVLIFDDWNCNKASPNYGERRAFQEFLDGQPRFTATPWFTYGYNGAAFILHDRHA